MKWYDYAACYFCADMIAAGLFSENVIILMLGTFTYIMYENSRKGENKWD